MIPWIFRGKVINNIDNLPDKVFGFIYEISFSNGMKYIGRKALFHNKTLKPLKGKKAKRKTVVESDWKKYSGSIKDKDFIEGFSSGSITVTHKEILKLCYSLWEMSYYETQALFMSNCLLSAEYYNNNILGKFYKPKTHEQEQNGIT